MMSEGQEGAAWSDAENDMVVADYFAMLSKELSGQSFVKAHHNQALTETIGRSKKSIEYKHMNISAVLERLAVGAWLPSIRFAIFRTPISEASLLDVNPMVLSQALVTLGGTPTDLILSRRLLIFPGTVV